MTVMPVYGTTTGDNPVLQLTFRNKTIIPGEILRPVLLLYAVIAVLAVSAEEPDTLSRSLGPVEVSAGKALHPIRSAADGTAVISGKLLSRDIHLFGEADYLVAARQSAGVNAAGSDYAGGLVVDGTGTSQTRFFVDNAPVFYPYHFGGIFSTFNASHFRSATLTRSIRPASAPNSLGGVFDVRSAGAVADRPEATLHIGMMAPSLAVSLPLWKGSSLAVAARRSLLNELYGWLLDTDDFKAKYALTDCNISLINALSGDQRLSVSFSANRDKLSYRDKMSALGLGLQWGNTVASATLTLDTSEHTAYFSRVYSRLGVAIDPIDITAPSSLWQTGVRGGFAFLKGWRVGYEVSLTRNELQNARVESSFAYSQEHSIQHMFEGSAWLENEWVLPRHWKLNAGMRLTVAGKYCGALPSVTLSRRFESGLRLHLHTGLQMQTIHSVGLSEIGFASNFYALPGRELDIQRSASFVAAAMQPIGENVTLQAQGYYKVLRGLPDYTANVLSLISESFSSLDAIQQGNGFATGCNLNLRYDYNNFSAAASYAYALSKVRFPDNPEVWVNAPGVLAHTLDISLRYSFGQYWFATALFTFRSGRPVTPIRSLYVIANNLVTEYGERNSGHLPSYSSLNLGLTYRIAGSNKLIREQLFNLSLINALNHKNVEMEAFTIDASTHTYRRRQIYSFFHLVPSFSYTVKF